MLVGFIEFTRSKFGGSSVYVNSDFAVPNTRYARLSKLMVMLLVSKDVTRSSGAQAAHARDGGDDHRVNGGR